MSIVFYQSPNSSAAPVAWALAELGVQHQSVKLDLPAGDSHKPEYLKLNPNGKVPLLVVDGTPMFEALAIMQWLSDRYGVEKRLWPAASDPARLPALSWTTWSYVTFVGTLMRLFMATSDRLGPQFHNAAQAEHTKRELADLLTILSGQLASNAYLLGAEFSMADLIVSGVIGFAAFSGVSLAAHPLVGSWLERCTARPSWRTSQGR
jgi:glutathione S-transferase